MKRVSIDEYISSEDPLEALSGKVMELDIRKWNPGAQSWAEGATRARIVWVKDEQINFCLLRKDGSERPPQTYVCNTTETRNMFVEVAEYSYKELP